MTSTAPPDAPTSTVTWLASVSRSRSLSGSGGASYNWTGDPDSTCTNTGTLPGTSTAYNDWALLSWLGRANYNIADKYLLTLTGRRDGSSRFGENNKWGFFPSAALAWRVINEGFMKDQSLFSDLKLRLS